MPTNRGLVEHYCSSIDGHYPPVKNNKVALCLLFTKTSKNYSYRIMFQKSKIKKKKERKKKYANRQHTEMCTGSNSKCKNNAKQSTEANHNYMKISR